MAFPNPRLYRDVLLPQKGEKSRVKHKVAENYSGFHLCWKRLEQAFFIYF